MEPRGAAISIVSSCWLCAARTYSAWRSTCNCTRRSRISAPQSRSPPPNHIRRLLARALATSSMAIRRSRSGLVPVQSQAAVALRVERQNLTGARNLQAAALGLHFQIFLPREARFDDVQVALLVEQPLFFLLQRFQFV